MTWTESFLAIWLLPFCFPALCLCWVWKEMAACARRCRPQQILLVRSTISHLQTKMCLREKCCNTAILICSKNTMNNWQVQNNYTLINQNVCIFSILFTRGAEEERWFLFILICHLKYHKLNFSWIGWWLSHWCTSDSHCSLSQHSILQIKAVLLRNVGFITVSVGGVSNNLDIYI